MQVATPEAGISLRESHSKCIEGNWDLHLLQESSGAGPSSASQAPWQICYSGKDIVTQVLVSPAALGFTYGQWSENMIQMRTVAPVRAIISTPGCHCVGVWGDQRGALAQVRDLRPGRKYAFRVVVHAVVVPPYGQPPAQPPSPVVVFETVPTVPAPPPPPEPTRKERTALMVLHCPMHASGNSKIEMMSV